MHKELMFPKVHEPWSLVTLAPQTTPLNRPPPLPCLFPSSKQKVITFPISGLRIQVDSNNETHDYFMETSCGIPSGYNQENCLQALKRFERRKTLRIFSTKTEQSYDNNFSVKKSINVNSINALNKTFEGFSSFNEKEAEQECDLKILKWLYVKDVIKEASVEFHKKRKIFADPSKNLDVKLQAYLNLDSKTFCNILDEIEKHSEYFCV